jgi:hypothetical protein
MFAVHSGVSGQKLKPFPGASSIVRAVVAQTIRGQSSAEDYGFALPDGEDVPVSRGNLLARLHLAFGAVFTDEDWLAPGLAVVGRAQVIAPAPKRIGRQLRSKTDVHRRSIDRHFRAPVGLGVKQHSFFPCRPGIGRTEIINASSVTAGAGLPAENMDRVADRDDVRPPNFLAGRGDSDGIAPICPVIGGLAKVQGLARWPHVAGSRQQVNSVPSRVEPAILHGVIDRGRRNHFRNTPSRAVILRASVHETASVVTNHVYSICHRDSPISRYKGKRIGPKNRLFKGRLNAGQCGNLSCGERERIYPSVIDQPLEEDFVPSLIARADLHLSAVVDTLAAQA